MDIMMDIIYLAAFLTISSSIQHTCLYCIRIYQFCKCGKEIHFLKSMSTARKKHTKQEGLHLHCRPLLQSKAFSSEKDTFISWIYIKLNFFVQLVCSWSLAFFMRQSKCWSSLGCKGKQLLVRTGVLRALGQPNFTEGLSTSRLYHICQSSSKYNIKCRAGPIFSVSVESACSYF